MLKVSELVSREMKQEKIEEVVFDMKMEFWYRCLVISYVMCDNSEKERSTS